MARRNSKDVRISKLSQRQIQKLERKKKLSDRRNDAKDWTNRLFATLNQDEGADSE